jgi:hypothetical protein
LNKFSDKLFLMEVEMATFNIANLTGETRQALEALRNMPVQLGEILEKARLEAIQIGLDTSLSLAGKNERYNQAASRFMAQVDKLQAAALAFEADLERWIASKLRQPQGDPNVELLYEIRTDKLGGALSAFWTAQATGRRLSARFLTWWMAQSNKVTKLRWPPLTRNCPPIFRPVLWSCRLT